MNNQLIRRTGLPARSPWDKPLKPTCREPRPTVIDIDSRLRSDKRLSLLAFIFLLLTVATTAADERPNIVFLMSDDQTTYSLGCYGTPHVKTPNIDQLAKDGMAFDKHYVSTAICMASRATVMTGKYEFKHGCNFEHGPLVREHWNQSYPMLLREAGYVTAIAGKIGFEVSEHPKKSGGKEPKASELPKDDFDRWGAGPGQTSYVTAKNKSMTEYATEYPHSTLSYGAFGRDFIQANADLGKPFCLSISFKAPHKPATPDAKFDDVYANQKFTRPANYGRQYGEQFSLQSRQGRQYERFHSWEYSSNYDQVMATYYQQIYAVDKVVGMIRDALRAAGVEKKTVVIFTSDNGFMCGSHGYGSKVLPYEESSRVPLVIYDPRNKNSGKQLRTSSLTGNVDIAPTVLDLAGLEVPPGIDGRSLIPIYDDPNATIHEHMPLVNVWGPRPVFSLSVVTKDWKYINWPYDEGKFTRTEELYHLTKDQLELKNVVNEDKEGLAKMRQLYDGYVAMWKREAVDYHRYAEWGVFFDRNSGLADKNEK